VIRVGPAGWSYADWEGVVYPRPKPRGFHPLPFLARFVGVIELNASFYALPRAEHAERWAELVRPFPDFRFTAKLHQDFTHTKTALDLLQREVGEFHSGLEPLVRAGRLSALLAQFPLGFTFTPDALTRVDALIAAFGRVPLVLELRHRSWFVPAALAELRGRACSLAAIDLPAAADHPPADHPTPGPIGYLRLHGRNAATWFARDAGRDQKYDYLYTQAEIAELAARARRLAGGHDETFVVTNNHFEGKAVANAIELLAALTGETAHAPRALTARYPRLLRVAAPEGQQEFF
jgi:uncharacterized protein YecE (DUF72 family)